MDRPLTRHQTASRLALTTTEAAAAAAVLLTAAAAQRALFLFLSFFQSATFPGGARAHACPRPVGQSEGPAASKAAAGAKAGKAGFLERPHLLCCNAFSAFVLSSMLREFHTDEATSASYFCLFLLFCHCLPGAANLPSSCSAGGLAGNDNK